MSLFIKYYNTSTPYLSISFVSEETRLEFYIRKEKIFQESSMDRHSVLFFGTARVLKGNGVENILHTTREGSV